MSAFMSHFKKQGFTLMELLVTIAILGILATVGWGQYRTSQEKARDAQRKADLDNIARALEMYYNDLQRYPSSLIWGFPLEHDLGSEIIVYMKKVPEDPSSDQDYCYQTDLGGSYFKLYAKLENEKDSDYYEELYSCNGVKEYSYGISSSNESP